MRKRDQLFRRLSTGMLAAFFAAGVQGFAAEPLSVPYTENFAKENFSGFTVIDGNNDGCKWEYKKNFDDLDAAYIDTQGVSTDDWLILPAVALDKGSLYKLSCTLHGVSFNFNECAEIYIGEEPTAEAMKKMVIEVVDMYTYRKDPLTTTGTFSVDDSGTYYIGIHASSAYKRYGIFILGLELTVDRAMSTPAAVSDFKVTPDIHGALEGTVEFTAPSKSVDGSALTGTLDVEIKRDGQLLRTEKGVSPGAKVSFAETAAEGLHTYTAVAKNGSGEGLSSEAEAFFGFDLPKAPASITVKETETPGKVLVTWDAVTEDINGKILPADEISYKLYGPGGVTVVSKLKDTQYTATATKKEQMFANYGVTTITSKGEGEEFILSDILAVGEPYALPWSETMKDGNFSSIIRYDDFDRYMRFGVYSSEETELEDADGSGYYLIGRAYDPNERCRLYTGKISLADTQYPALTFSYYSIPATTNTVEVFASDGEGWKPLKKIVVDGTDSEWVTAYVDLSEYKGKWVELAFEATVLSHISIALDNFLVSDRPATDLTLAAFTAPESIKVGEPGVFSAIVENKGGKENASYTVGLYRNGVMVDEKSAVSALKPGEKATFGFTDNLDVTSAESNTYSVMVKTEGDNNETDNKSEEKGVATTQPIYPYVTSLRGEGKDGEAILTWDEPDFETMVFEPITESFESYTDFEIDNCGEWSFIDGDGSKTYYLEDFEFPNQGKEMASIVLPSSFFSGWKNFEAHGGGKLLASFSAVNGPNDDWMISPELIGDEQEISFYAKSMSSVYPDSFEFYYSTTGKDRDDFIQIGDEIEAPHDWTQFSYELPEGAKYFAVRYVSGDGFVFMVDDFRFVPASARNLMDELALVGYNVYRDNQRINKEPVEEPEFTDKGVSAGDHRYSVTAVYLQGESRLGNDVEVSIEGSGIIAVEAAENAEAQYYGLSGIRVDNPEKGSVYIVVRGGKASKEIFK